MTARKFVVSKRGVKREVRSPKASARERLTHAVRAAILGTAGPRKRGER